MEQLKCPKCGREVSEVIVEEKSFHRVRLNSTIRKVDWDVDGEPLGLILFHSDEENDEPCLFTPADDEALLNALSAWLLSEDGEVCPEIAHLFAESEVVRSVEGK
jgi:hypothetical protein